MAPKPHAGLGSALLPIGAVAIVAGCSGGSVNSSGAYTPPLSGAGAANRPMTTAQITLQFGPGSSSTGRQAMSLNPTVRQVGVRFIPLPAPAVTPTEQVFTIPQPAPASTTLTVQAPVGQDQFILGAYEPPPNCSLSSARAPQALPSLVPLNGSVQTVNLSQNGTNTITAAVAPVAFGGAVSASPVPSLPSAGYLGTVQWSPFENLSIAQSTPIKVVPVNVCGTQLPTTTVANSVVVSGPGGVAFSSATFSATGSTTATYAANTNTGGTISASATLPANTAPQNAAQTVKVVPDYYIFAIDPMGSYLSVLDSAGGNAISSGLTLAHSRVPISQARAALHGGTRKTQAFSGGGVTAMAAVNASPCTSGSVAAAVAVVGTINAVNGIDIFTVTPSGSIGGPTFLPWTSASLSSLGVTSPGTPESVAFDAACRLYVGDSFGYLGVGSTTGIVSVANENGFSGYGVTALLAGPGSMYAGYQNGGNWLVGTFPFGGTSITPSPTFSLSTSSYVNVDALALAGGNVFVASTTSSCYADYRALSSGAMIIADQSVGSPPGTTQFFGSTTGTLYAVTGQGYLLTISGGTVTPMMTAPGGGAIAGVALSMDSPTSSLWLSGNTGVYQFSISGATLTAGRSITGVSPSPGPLSIAP